jgi:hypothetical protein
MSYFFLHEVDLENIESVCLSVHFNTEVTDCIPIIFGICGINMIYVHISPEPGKLRQYRARLWAGLSGNRGSILAEATVFSLLLSV